MHTVLQEAENLYLYHVVDRQIRAIGPLEVIAGIKNGRGVLLCSTKLLDGDERKDDGYIKHDDLDDDASLSVIKLRAVQAAVKRRTTTVSASDDVSGHYSSTDENSALSVDNSTRSQSSVAHAPPTNKGWTRSTIPKNELSTSDISRPFRGATKDSFNCKVMIVDALSPTDFRAGTWDMSKAYETEIKVNVFGEKVQGSLTIQKSHSILFSSDKVLMVIDSSSHFVITDPEFKSYTGVVFTSRVLAGQFRLALSG
eukprot:TRINITY_DN3202_c0_g1_i2.p1 TRINITY_DN3202_c0_g1~~TRINITY_DN3202_c0_g1_i2.p1  ORF type:complete len:255 (-),score=50.89 TRINITY_DN3202_c0_g1_i2:192-956(-)